MDWSGIDFSDCDLNGFDFTGANLTGCTFRRARIAGATFDQAQVERRALLRAIDWPAHLQHWHLPERRQPCGAHLPDLAIFGDAPWCPELVVLPAGEFFMGSPEGEEGRYNNEGPQHRVRIDARFALGRYPVTFEEYDHFCAMTKRELLGDAGWGRGRRPVINVSWGDAVAYCKWLSRETGQPYRLPSEAEWEYGCRAGTTTRFSWGDAITPDKANYDGSNSGRTTEVGGYPANPWGLYDMHENVWELAGDVWHDPYQDAPTDGSAWTDIEGSNYPRERVVRGGSWVSDSRDLRSAIRLRHDPFIRYYSLGFRVARTLH